MVSWDLVWDAAWKVGLPFVMTCTFIWALYKGWYVRSGEVQRLIDAYERDIRRLEADLAKSEAEAGEWKLIALRGTDIAELLTRKVVS